MPYKGVYKPSNPKKYQGNPNNIIYRSLWERKFMNYCDLNESIQQWQSEEFWIPYVSPVDNRVHRYFPDFFIKYNDKNGTLRTMVVEIKPKKQVAKPTTNPKRRTKAWANSVTTWMVNQAKWKAAKEFCADRKFEFKIMTEDDLGIK
jgi:hypothetical protein